MQSSFKIPDPNFSATLPAEKSKYSYGKKMCRNPENRALQGAVLFGGGCPLWGRLSWGRPGDHEYTTGGTLRPPRPLTS